MADERPTATSTAADLGPDDHEALAVLFEDHTPREDVPPDAFNTKPPITQQQSDLLNILHDFVEGKQDWDVTKSELVAFPYAPKPKADGSPVGDGAGAWWSDTEATAMGRPADNTWQQLESAASAGMLSQQQMTEVVQGIADRSKQGGGDAPAADAAPDDEGAEPAPDDETAEPAT